MTTFTNFMGKMEVAIAFCAKFRIRMHVLFFFKKFFLLRHGDFQNFGGDLSVYVETYYISSMQRRFRQNLTIFEFFLKKSRFFEKIEIFQKNRDFSKKLRFFGKIKIFRKNRDFSKNQDFSKNSRFFEKIEMSERGSRDCG